MPQEEQIVTEQPGTEKPAGTEQLAGQKPAAGSEQRPAAGEKPAGEDPRIKGMLADLQKERTARQAAETRQKALEADFKKEQRRVQIALGVNPPSQEEQDGEQIRAALYKLVPQLEKLTPEQVDKILAVAESGDELRNLTSRQWENHGKTMLNKVASGIADELGGGELTPRQRQTINNAYIAAAAANPEFLQRHEAGDDTLVEEFVKQFIEDWGGPIRRTVTATEVSRQRPLPNGRGRNVQGQAPKKIDFSNPKAVEDAMVESFKSHGGTFPG